VCRFFENPNGANGPGLPPNGKLATEHIILQPRPARSLARSFNRLPPHPQSDSKMRICSSEFGGGFYVRFLFADGRRSSVEVIPSACPRAVAGKHGGWLLLSGALRQRLEAIAPLP